MHTATPTDQRAALENSRRLALLYGATIFLSAFLLFQVQPIIGKQVLPWFGGSAFVWTTCLLFFQGLLLLGYLYCHWLVRYLSARGQSLLHAAVLATSCLFLPIVADPAWQPAGAENPSLRILGALAATIGLPYFVLSTTGPLLQVWFARERPGSVPYRLFALSNLGSMVALLGYPFAVEPVLETHTQSLLWSSGFAAFVMLCLVLALRAARCGASGAAGDHHAKSKRLRLRELALWVALAACPSLLLVSITAYLTQNVAPVPLLWVLPLALYLLSFILCFEHPRWYRRIVFVPLFIAGLAALAYLPKVDLSDLSTPARLGAYLLALFAFCMVCHGELVRRRPDVSHLTAFYLMIALGGALGGVFVALIAPTFFVGDFELPIGLFLTAALALGLLVGAPELARRPGLRQAAAVGGGGLVGALAFTLAQQQWQNLHDARVTARSFYGTLRVRDIGTGEDAYRRLLHGNIIHGEQFLDPQRQRRPTTYYGEQTGAGLALAALRKPLPPGAGLRLGVVGLGAGTLLTYGRRADVVRVYEINPQIVAIARSQFTYLADTRARVDIALGDGRLSLEREPPQQFDILLVDAFSGDSVPVHLLTLEAFRLYLKHLKRNGVLALHVSNKFLDLAPIVELAAGRLGKPAVLVVNEKDEEAGVFSSSWVLISDNRAVLDDQRVRAASKEIADYPSLKPWTDSYSSLFAVMK